jgi:hypothetical protein
MLIQTVISLFYFHFLVNLRSSNMSAYVTLHSLNMPVPTAGAYRYFAVINLHFFLVLTIWTVEGQPRITLSADGRYQPKVQEELSVRSHNDN